MNDAGECSVEEKSYTGEERALDIERRREYIDRRSPGSGGGRDAVGRWSLRSAGGRNRVDRWGLGSGEEGLEWVCGAQDREEEGLE